MSEQCRRPMTTYNSHHPLYTWVGRYPPTNTYPFSLVALVKASHLGTPESSHEIRTPSLVVSFFLLFFRSLISQNLREGLKEEHHWFETDAS